MAFDIDDDIALHDRTLPRIWRTRVNAQPNAPFLWFPQSGNSSLADIDRQVLCAAVGLLARSVARADRVCVFMRNSPGMVSILLALWHVGAVVVPLSAQQRGQLLKDQVDRADARLVIADDDLASEMRAAGIEPVIADALFLGEAEVAADSLDTLARNGPSFHDPAMIMYTSGSTGPSKGCLLSHHMCSYYGWVFWRYMGYRASDTIHTCLPLNHNHALFASFFPAVLSGARFALSRKFSATRYWHEIVESGATTCSAIGPMASILMGQPVGEIEASLQVRLAHIAPSPLRVEDFQERFGLQVVSCLYGATEAMVFPPDPSRKPVMNLIGAAPRDWDVAIVDEHGFACPEDVVGELVVRPRRPKILFDGYFRMPEATAAAWRDLWYHTGDRCKVDRDGCYWFSGRAKEIVRRRGENISMWEIEAALGKYIGIDEIAAIAVPQDDGDENLGIVIRPSTGHEISALFFRQFCERELPRFMYPDHILIRETEFPKTQSGKIDRIAVLADALPQLADLGAAQSAAGGFKSRHINEKNELSDGEE